jgi:hypothetical protein
VPRRKGKGERQLWGELGERAPNTRFADCLFRLQVKQCVDRVADVPTVPIRSPVSHLNDVD